MKEQQSLKTENVLQNSFIRHKALKVVTMVIKKCSHKTFWLMQNKVYIHLKKSNSSEIFI